MYRQMQGWVCGNGSSLEGGEMPDHTGPSTPATEGKMALEETRRG